MNRIKIEWLIFKQYLLFSIRNRRYFFIAIPHYSFSIKSPKISYRLRLLYSTLQLIDDLIDGDRTFRFDTKEYITSLINEEFDKIANHDLKILYQESILLIRKEFHENSELEIKFIRLINTMLVDLERRKFKMILNDVQLKKHFQSTFSDSVDIILISLESKTRIENIQEALELFEWSSLIRDLEEDYHKNIINIPINALNYQSGNFNISFNEFLNREDVSNYLKLKKAGVEPSYHISMQKIENYKGDAGYLFLKVTIKSMKKYLR